AGFDRLLAGVNPPGVPPDFERPAPPNLLIQPLPDGTKKITVTAEVSEPVPKKKSSKAPNPQCQVTGPVLPKTQLTLTAVNIEAKVADGGPTFLEVRSRFDNYKTVVARVALTPGVGTYTLQLNLKPSTKPGTLRFFAVNAANAEAGIDLTRIQVAGIL